MHIITSSKYSGLYNKASKMTIYFKGEELEQPLSLYISFFLFGIFWAYITAFSLVLKHPVPNFIGGLLFLNSVLAVVLVGMGVLYSGGVKTSLATAVATFIPTPVLILLGLLVR